MGIAVSVHHSLRLVQTTPYTWLYACPLLESTLHSPLNKTNNPKWPASASPFWPCAFSWPSSLLPYLLPRTTVPTLTTGPSTWTKKWPTLRRLCPPTALSPLACMLRLLPQPPLARLRRRLRLNPLVLLLNPLLLLLPRSRPLAAARPRVLLTPSRSLDPCLDNCWVVLNG